MQTGTVLIVDDNKSVLTSLELLLEDEFERVETASNPNSILSVLDTMPVDLVILDMNFSAGVNTGNEGLFWLRRIQEIAPELPVIMLTARSEDTDKIIGFECGADDYITKPFNILELKARIRAMLRRAGTAHQKDKTSRLQVGHIALDTDERSASKDGQAVDLTAKEFDLMELLMRNPGRVYSRENLLNIVWGYEYAGEYRTVDVHIRRLREKLELDPANPEYILTKWGVGYYLKNG